jgi:hypothetical protein
MPVNASFVSRQTLKTRKKFLETAKKVDSREPGLNPKTRDLKIRFKNLSLLVVL